MTPESLLTTGEFTRSMDRLTDAVNVRFDRLERGQDDHAKRIAGVEVMLAERTIGNQKMARSTASTWGASVAGACVGAFEIIKAVWSWKSVSK